MLIAACTSAPKSNVEDEGEACADKAVCEEPAEPEKAKPEPTKTDLQVMQDRIDEVTARDEVDVDTIEVQHLLVGVTNPRLPDVNRNEFEAREIAAEFYARILNGEDLDALVNEFTNDSPPGIYAMTTGKGSKDPLVLPRTMMVPAFGNVGWRLEVGEVSVAPFDKKSSPFGFHIIKRLK